MSLLNTFSLSRGLSLQIVEHPKLTASATLAPLPSVDTEAPTLATPAPESAPEPTLAPDSSSEGRLSGLLPLRLSTPGTRRNRKY